MRSERIALIVPYALSVFGGVQEQALAMSRELARRGYEVAIIAPDEHDAATYDTPALVRRFGRLVQLPANGSRAPLTLSLLAAKRAGDAVLDFQPDVVHFHEPFAPLVGWGVLRAHRSPAVATFHRSGTGPALRYTGSVLRRLARNIDVAVAVSESAATTIAGAVGLETRVLFNGFETERFVSSERRRDPGTLVVALGRLDERKGTQYAIRAVQHHNAEHPEQWRLVIIGDGAQRATLERVATGDRAVEFVGAVSDSQKRAWLRRANVVVAAATHGESFGLVLLEAMASEASVVASDIDGYREAAGAHAVLFAPGDHRALESAIGRALAQETSVSVANARRHAQHWSMVALVDAYEEVYEEARQRFKVTR